VVGLEGGKQSGKSSQTMKKKECGSVQARGTKTEKKFPLEVIVRKGD